MDIIAHGKEYEKDRTVHCECGCTYLYSNEDVRLEYPPTSSIYRIAWPSSIYTICPECYKRSFIVRRDF